MVFYPEVEYEGRFLNEAPSYKSKVELPGYSAIDRLIHADTNHKLKSFMDKWPNLFNTVEYHSTMDTYKDVRDLLILAMNLKSLVDGEECTKDNLVNLGFFFDYFDSMINCANKPLPLGSGEVQMESKVSLRSRDYGSYLQKASWDVSTPISANELSGAEDFPRKIVDSMHEDRPILGWPENDLQQHEENVYIFHLYAGPFDNIESGFKQLAKQALDELVTLHFFDVRAYLWNGEIAFQSSSVLSGLWISLASGFSEGRADTCMACGKPFIAFGERGNQRLYCSSACNKKYQRYKRFESLMLQGLSPLEAAKKAGINLDTALKIKKNNQPTPPTDLGVLE